MVSGIDVLSNTPKARIRLLAHATLVITAVAMATWVAGCASPAYYWQATSGHLALMHARQPVDATIERGDESAEVIDKLRLSKEIKAFAVTDLGLPDNNSYEAYVRTGREAVVWNVIGAPEFSLQARQWCFPVAGCVPYRGYFDQEGARRFAEKLAGRNLDVTVSPAIAYSTLGWFKDPLLDTMWRRSDVQFAAYIFHEIAHQALYVRDDARFNESYASFVEDIGVERWLAQRGERKALERWQSLSAAGAEFNALLGGTRDRLQDIYASARTPEAMRSEKRAAFEHLESEYNTLRDRQWNGQDYFGGWFSQPPNNARFALLDTYQGGTCAFAALYDEAGGDMAAFHRLAQEKSRLPAVQRRRWLEQDCPAPEIAPVGEL